MAEFTGERVIPGLVDVNLFNEHMARYAFASRLARGKRVLDAGCGSGYGSAELAHTAAHVNGIDVADDAIAYARQHYPLHNLTFEQGSCNALPHPDAIFELVVAFEVIEHLEDWRGFLREARRVLVPNGQFIVSTPNRLYYAESRGTQGANPFHVHEFEFEEFREELLAFFPHVSLYLENHIEGVSFHPHEASNMVDVKVETSPSAPAESHFFVAVCARRPQIGNPTFVYVPRGGNVLRERERHIALLEAELAQKDEWLGRAQLELRDLNGKHAKLIEELKRSNTWAEELNRELKQRGDRITELQHEFESAQQGARNMADSYAAKVQELELDVQAKTKWAQDTETRLTAELKKQTEALSRAVDVLHETEKDLETRTDWAISLQRDLEKTQRQAQALLDQLTLYQASRWVKLGRKVGLGPVLPAE